MTDSERASESESQPEPQSQPTPPTEAAPQAQPPAELPTSPPTQAWNDPNATFMIPAGQGGPPLNPPAPMSPPAAAPAAPIPPSSAPPVSPTESFPVAYAQEGYPQAAPPYYPQGAYAQAPPPGYPQGTYPGAAYPPGAAPATGYPVDPNAYPPGAVPPGGYPAGGYPPGYPPGAVPPGAMPPPGWPAPQPRKRRKTWLILTAVFAVLLVALSGGAFAAYKVWYGWGTQPEDVIPGSAAAFTRVDLRPGVGQRLWVARQAKKFPSDSPAHDPKDEARDAGEVVDLPNADYNEDIKPWFDDRFGFAYWKGKDGQYYAVTVVATSDEGKARRALKRIRARGEPNELAYTVKDDYAIVVTPENSYRGDPEVALRQLTREGSLADRSTYAGAVRSIPRGQAIIAWVDLGRVGRELGQGATGGLLGGGPSDSSAWRGQFITGVSATRTGAEVAFRWINPPKIRATGSVANTVGQLPGNSIVAGGVSGAAFGPAWATMRGMLTGGIEDWLGEDVADDVLDGKYAFAVTDINSRRPGYMASGTFGETRTADRVASSLRREFRYSEGRVEQDGNTVRVQSEAYSPSGGKLADKENYQAVLDDLPDRPVAILYVDLEKVRDLVPAGQKELRESMEPLRSFGMVIGIDDGDYLGYLRVATK